MCVSAISSPFVGPRVSCLSSSELCRIACVSSAFGPPPSPPSLLCEHVACRISFPISPAYAQALLHKLFLALPTLLQCNPGTHPHVVRAGIASVPQGQARGVLWRRKKIAADTPREADGWKSLTLSDVYDGGCRSSRQLCVWVLCLSCLRLRPVQFGPWLGVGSSGTV